MTSPIQIERANIRRAITALELLAAKLGTSQRSPATLTSYDVLQYVFPDVDFSEAMQAECEFLGLNADGYPLTDEGDLDIRADRVWIPAPRLSLSEVLS